MLSPEFIHKPTDYEGILKEITSRPLTTSNIDSYADQALKDLVELTELIVYAYSSLTESVPPDKTEIEDEAFRHFKLSDISTILDHIAKVADTIESLNFKISNIPIVPEEFVPQDPNVGTLHNGGNGEYERPHKTPRLKTLLFILKSDFGVDLDDPSQISLLGSSTNHRTLRESSYYSVFVPGLKRLIFICDERKNTTFVFNTGIVESLGIDLDTLVNHSKSELKALISSNPGIGLTVRFSKEYVSNLRKAIMSEDDPRRNERGQNGYLKPNKDELKVSLNGLARRLNMAPRTLATAIDDLQQQGIITPPESAKERYGVIIGDHFEDGEVEIIEGHLRDKGYFAEIAAEGILSATGIAKKLRVAKATVKTAVKKLGEDLGEVEIYRFGEKGNEITMGFDIPQQKAIEQALQSSGRLAKRATDGISSGRQLRTELGFSGRKINQAVAALYEKLGPLVKYRFRSCTAIGYDPEQKRKIAEYLDSADHKPQSVE